MYPPTMDDDPDLRSHRAMAAAADIAEILRRVADLRAAARQHHDAMLDQPYFRSRLCEMADGDRDPLMREMARDLLAGGISFSEALSFEPYAEVIHRRGESLSTWYHSLSDEQREALATFVADAGADLPTAADGR